MGSGTAAVLLRRTQASGLCRSAADRARAGNSATRIFRSAAGLSPGPDDHTISNICRCAGVLPIFGEPRRTSRAVLVWLSRCRTAEALRFHLYRRSEERRVG